MRIPVPPRKTVVVPAPDLDEADAAFEEASCHQAFARKIFTLLTSVDLFRPGARTLLEPVKFQHARRFLRNLERFRRRELHFRRELITADPRLEPRIAGASRGMPLIEFREQGNRRRLALRADEPLSLFRRKKIDDRRRRAGV